MIVSIAGLEANVAVVRIIDNLLTMSSKILSDLQTPNGGGWLFGNVVNADKYNFSTSEKMKIEERLIMFGCTTSTKQQGNMNINIKNELNHEDTLFL